MPEPKFDILKSLKEQLNTKQKPLSSMSNEEIKARLSEVNREAAMNKLRSIGLGSIAEKIKNMSNEELAKIISENPALQKKIDAFMK